MEKEKNSNIEMLSDVIKNCVEAGLKIAARHYHMITDLQQLLFEKDKVFRILGEQVFQMIDQGRIFAPAIMQTTFRAAKEIIERIAHLEAENKNKKREVVHNSDKDKKVASTSNIKPKNTIKDNRKVSRKAAIGKKKPVKKSAGTNKFKKKASMKKK